MRENTRRFVRRLKVLELNIESRDYDFLGMAGEIEVWCEKNQITPKLANRVQLVFEETIQLLVPLLESLRIEAVCEYSEAAETAEWTICYGGRRLEVTEVEDDLALALLKGMTESMDYSWVEGMDLQNRLRLVVKG